MFNGEEFGKQIVAATTAHVDKTVAPLVAELTAMRAEIAALKAQKQFDPAEMDWRLETFANLMREERDVRNAEGKEKRKAALADLKAGILADCETLVTEKIAAIPAPTAPLAREAIVELIIDMVAPLTAELRTQIADIPPAPELPNIPALISEAIEAAKPEPVDLNALVSEAVAALPPAEKGKDADPELVASLVAEHVERAVAALPVPKAGEPGADGVTLEELLPVIGQEVAKAVSVIPVPKDGRNAVDLADMLVVEGGDVVATFTDGRTKVLGPFRGKDGEPGKDGKDFDAAEIDRLIAEKVAKIQPPEIERDAYLAAFAPDDVAVNVSLAVKMMAETPQTVPVQQRSEPPLHFHSNVNMPGINFPENMVTVSMPEMTVAAPIVNVDPVVNNVMPPVEPSKKRKEITKVTGWDKNGRITSFEKTESD